MGNANLKKTPLPLNRNDEVITPQIKEEDKKTGKSFINSIFAKLEIFERREITITLQNPLLNISSTIKIINEEKLDNILYDYYPIYSPDLIASLNGYILTKEESLTANNVQDKDDIFISEPIHFKFLLSDGKKFEVKSSKYQIFFDVFQRFRLKECPKEYKNRFSECYFNNRLIKSFDNIYSLGIKENDEIFVVLGIDNNTKCEYDKGIETLKRFNFIYKNKNENNINLNDFKIELSNKIIDNEELNNFGTINFINLKYLTLIDCKIQTIYFLNSPPLSSLREVNLKSNNISFFEDLVLSRLENLDLSFNNLNKNMLHENNRKNIININLPSLKILNLSNNKIEIIDILSQFKIESLKELYLNNNEIENVDVLNKVSCGKLKKLNLSNNKINDISIFSQLSFCNNIENLNLMNNEIVNLNKLRNISLPRLKILNILNNDISDYSVFKLIFLPKLQYLYAFPSQLDPDDYDKTSEIFIKFNNSCDNIIEKGVEIRYKI